MSLERDLRMKYVVMLAVIRQIIVPSSDEIRKIATQEIMVYICMDIAMNTVVSIDSH